MSSSSQIRSNPKSSPVDRKRKRAPEDDVLTEEESSDSSNSVSESESESESNSNSDSDSESEIDDSNLSNVKIRAMGHKLAKTLNSIAAGNLARECMIYMWDELEPETRNELNSVIKEQTKISNAKTTALRLQSLAQARSKKLADEKAEIAAKQAKEISDASSRRTRNAQYMTQKQRQEHLALDLLSNSNLYTVNKSGVLPISVLSAILKSEYIKIEPSLSQSEKFPPPAEEDDAIGVYWNMLKRILPKISIALGKPSPATETTRFIVGKSKYTVIPGMSCYGGSMRSDIFLKVMLDSGVTMNDLGLELV